MSKFKEWFEKNLIVGGFPHEDNRRFDVNDFDYVINVSDEYYTSHHLLLIANNIKSFWFPMNECKRDIGLNSIYGAMIVLFAAEKRNSRVYLHCHAGVNRSQTVRAAYYYMRTGHQYESDLKRGFINQLYANCSRGYLPPMAEMESFLNQINIKLNTDLQQRQLMGGFLDTAKIEAINNF
jgi:hypothetical protein